MYVDSTVHLWGVSILAFCHWLEQEGIIDESVTNRFKLPRPEEKFIPTFTAEEVQKLFHACDDCKSCTPSIRKALTARNKAMLAVLIDAGLRLSELAGLRLCDVDKDLRLLLVHRKGNKWQQVPVSRGAFRFLHEYLTKHRKRLAEVSGRSVARKVMPSFFRGRVNLLRYTPSSIFLRDYGIERVLMGSGFLRITAVVTWRRLNWLWGEVR
jgi:site-specific recombinase XerD